MSCCCSAFCCCNQGYRGCDTERNRCCWASFLTLAVSGILLFFMGASRHNSCNYIEPVPDGCKVAPSAMLIVGALFIIAALATQLYFCFCSQGPARNSEVSLGKDGRPVALTASTCSHTMGYKMCTCHTTFGFHLALQAWLWK
jgi:hypothetical protein